MKHRLLTALGIRRQANAYTWWGVPYNPYGATGAYNHPYPLRFFDFTSEVKLGDGFWAFVGGAASTYTELLGLYRAVGVEYRARLDALRRALAGPPV
jgi:hypothetical protein